MNSLLNLIAFNVQGDERKNSKSVMEKTLLWWVHIYPVAGLIVGVLRQWPLGEVFPARRSPDHWRLQDVQVPEELHHHQGRAEEAHGPAAEVALPAPSVEGHAGLRREQHGDRHPIRKDGQCKCYDGRWEDVLPLMKYHD